MNAQTETNPQAAEAEAADLAPKVAELEAALAAAQAKAEDNWNQYMRARAEAENMRRRFERDVENAHKYALEKFVTELVPVLDGLTLGLHAAANASPEVKKFAEGSEMTFKMLSGALEKFAVKEINPVGEKFNPDRHLAMSMQESATHEPNTVLTVVQKGYMLADRLIRPAMVVVSKAAAKPEGSNVDLMA